MYTHANEGWFCIFKSYRFEGFSLSEIQYLNIITSMLEDTREKVLYTSRLFCIVKAIQKKGVSQQFTSFRNPNPFEGQAISGISYRNSQNGGNGLVNIFVGDWNRTISLRFNCPKLQTKPLYLLVSNVTTSNLYGLYLCKALLM